LGFHIAKIRNFLAGRVEGSTAPRPRPPPRHRALLAQRHSDPRREPNVGDSLSLAFQPSAGRLVPCFSSTGGDV